MSDGPADDHGAGRTGMYLLFALVIGAGGRDPLVRRTAGFRPEAGRRALV